MNPVRSHLPSPLHYPRFGREWRFRYTHIAHAADGARYDQIIDRRSVGFVFSLSLSLHTPLRRASEMCIDAVAAAAAGTHALVCRLSVPATATAARNAAPPPPSSASPTPDGPTARAHPINSGARARPFPGPTNTMPLYALNARALAHPSGSAVGPLQFFLALPSFFVIFFFFFCFLPFPVLRRCARARADTRTKIFFFFCSFSFLGRVRENE